MVYLQLMWWVVLRVKTAQMLLEVDISKQGERGMLLDTAAITVETALRYNALSAILGHHYCCIFFPIAKCALIKLVQACRVCLFFLPPSTIYCYQASSFQEGCAK
jgi:hypothetical protein